MPNLLDYLKQELERLYSSDFIALKQRMESTEKEYLKIQQEYLKLKEEYSSTIDYSNDLKAVIAFLEER